MRKLEDSTKREAQRNHEQVGVHVRSLARLDAKVATRERTGGPRKARASTQVLRGKVDQINSKLADHAQSVLSGTSVSGSGARHLGGLGSLEVRRAARAADSRFGWLEVVGRGRGRIDEARPNGEFLECEERRGIARRRTQSGAVQDGSVSLTTQRDYRCLFVCLAVIPRPPRRGAALLFVGERWRGERPGRQQHQRPPIRAAKSMMLPRVHDAWLSHCHRPIRGSSAQWAKGQSNWLLLSSCFVAPAQTRLISGGGCPRSAPRFFLLSS